MDELAITPTWSFDGLSLDAVEPRLKLEPPHAARFKSHSKAQDRVEVANIDEESLKTSFLSFDRKQIELYPEELPRRHLSPGTIIFPGAYKKIVIKTCPPRLSAPPRVSIAPTNKKYRVPREVGTNRDDMKTVFDKDGFPKTKEDVALKALSYRRSVPAFDLKKAEDYEVLDSMAPKKCNTATGYHLPSNLFSPEPAKAVPIVAPAPPMEAPTVVPTEYGIGFTTEDPFVEKKTIRTSPANELVNNLALMSLQNIPVAPAAKDDADYTRRTFVVLELPKGTTPLDLHGVFSRFGKLEAVNIIINDEDPVSVEGYVKFFSEADAKRASETLGMLFVLKGQAIHLQPPVTDEFNALPPGGENPGCFAYFKFVPELRQFCTCDKTGKLNARYIEMKFGLVVATAVTEKDTGK